MRAWLLFPAHGGYQSAEPNVLLGLFGTGFVWIGGRWSSLEAASSQTWARCLRDTLTAFAFASRAHRKHSSAIARYSAGVFMGRCASVPMKILYGLPHVCLLQTRLIQGFINGLRIVVAGSALAFE